MKKSIALIIDSVKSRFGGLESKASPLLNLIVIVLALVIVIGGIYLFVMLTNRIESEIVAEFDFQITEYLISHRTPLLTKYFVFVTHLGDVVAYVIILIVLMLLSAFVVKRWKYALQIGFVLVLSSVANVILKSLVNRERPIIDHMVFVDTLSYPSGHAMAAMTFYGFLIYLITKFRITILLKISFMLICVLLILSIGLSRIYLGVHFPSDVVGGYIAGLIWIVFCMLVFEFLEVFRHNSSNTVLK